jgi:hypothetical protein
MKLQSIVQVSIFSQNKQKLNWAPAEESKWELNCCWKNDSLSDCWAIFLGKIMMFDACLFKTNLFYDMLKEKYIYFYIRLQNTCLSFVKVGEQSNKQLSWI